eukprot:scaffold9573_cov119-Skeletonema_menzelii.AAC.2
MSISGDEYDGFLNFGDCLSPKTELLIIKNYAPLSCFGKMGIRGDFNLISRSNVCILQYLKVLPRSLYKEAGGEDWTDELAESIGECISFIDLHLLVPKKKKTYMKEIRFFAERHNVSELDLKLVTFISHAMHIKYYQLVHGRDRQVGRDTKVLTVVAASKPAHDSFFGHRDEFGNDIVNNEARLPHGEDVATRRLARYPDEKLEEISNRLLRVFTAVSEVVPAFVVPSPEDGSLIAQRFSGRISMTEDEKLAQLESIRESCRKGGQKSAKMLEDAADLVLQLMADEVCKSFKEALELIEFFFSLEHRNRWEGTQMAKIAGAFVTEQQKEGKCMTTEDALEAITNEFGEKGKSYANAWEGTQMAKIAGAFVTEQQKKGKCMTTEDALEAITNEFGEKGKSYANAWETGDALSKFADKVKALRSNNSALTRIKAAQQVAAKEGTEKK